MSVMVQFSTFSEPLIGTIVKTISETKFTGAVVPLSKNENKDILLLGNDLSAFNVMV